MSDKHTETPLEKRFRELQEKYINLSMNSRLLEQEYKEGKAKVKAAENASIVLKSVMVLGERQKKKLEKKLKLAFQERDELRDCIRRCLVENRELKKRVEKGEAAVGKVHMRVVELEEVIDSLTQAKRKEE